MHACVHSYIASELSSSWSWSALKNKTKKQKQKTKTKNKNKKGKNLKELEKKSNHDQWGQSSSICLNVRK